MYKGVSQTTEIKNTYKYFSRFLELSLDTYFNIFSLYPLPKLIIVTLLVVFFSGHLHATLSRPFTHMPAVAGLE